MPKNCYFLNILSHTYLLHVTWNKTKKCTRNMLRKSLTCTSHKILQLRSALRTVINCEPSTVRYFQNYRGSFDKGWRAVKEVSFQAGPRCIKNVSSASRVGVPSIPPWLPSPEAQPSLTTCLTLTIDPIAVWTPAPAFRVQRCKWFSSKVHRLWERSTNLSFQVNFFKRDVARRNLPIFLRQQISLSQPDRYFFKRTCQVRLSTIFPVKTRREPYTLVTYTSRWEINRTTSRSWDESIAFKIGAFRTNGDWTGRNWPTSLNLPFRALHVSIRASWNLRDTYFVR